MCCFLGHSAHRLKCNGADPCSTCATLGIQCHYNPQLYPRPNQKRVYIAALEDRVAELERLLASLGHETVSNDHWRGPLQFDDDSQTPQNDENAIVSGSPADHFTSPGTNHDEGKSTLSLGGSVFGSIIKSWRSSTSEAWKDEESSKPVLTSELVEKMGRMFVSLEAAPKLLEGWMKYLSTQYPVIHTPRLRELHDRRDEDLNIVEESMLHLIYANSGRVLEAVRN